MVAEGWTELAENALQAFGAWNGASRLVRRRLLDAWLEDLAQVREPLALAMARETGKPITLARGEVGRAEATLRASIDAVASFGEESVPYDLMAGADGCRATFRRFPLGPVLAITPFNFPVNLAMHKLAPALGVGCSVIWKPCPQAPTISARRAAVDANSRSMIE